jgi:hypothetical protein
VARHAAADALREAGADLVTTSLDEIAAPALLRAGAQEDAR